MLCYVMYRAVTVSYYQNETYDPRVGSDKRNCSNTYGPNLMCRISFTDFLCISILIHYEAV